MGRGTSCDVASSFLGASEVVVVVAQQTLFVAEPKWDPNGLLQREREHWGKEGLTHQPCGPWLTPGQISSSQGFLPWPALAPGAPTLQVDCITFHLRCLPQLPQALK